MPDETHCCTSKLISEGLEGGLDSRHILCRECGCVARRRSTPGCRQECCEEDCCAPRQAERAGAHAYLPRNVDHRGLTSSARASLGPPATASGRSASRRYQ